ncbi:carbonic anhydrase 2 [Orussus abietinus]|uniref:carbonic anhydrase 2 n=1 Tax=Orussus abietinus TaxID=222816 RepID=UPI00062681C6|nr:carbonic anhydrase 2 [Orussus abietinus]XP_012283529.1 carbonic anhydrase 2 [Orussus abietinus]XP_012283531.1 carbonic anhydrase 2 [Orussus abietinus]
MIYLAILTYGFLIVRGRMHCINSIFLGFSAIASLHACPDTKSELASKTLKFIDRSTEGSTLRNFLRRVYNVHLKDEEGKKSSEESEHPPLPRRAEEEDEDSHDSEHHFDYKSTENWADDYPACGGVSQSPIDLKPSEMTRLEVPSLLTWTGYSKPPKEMTITNNGHTVQVSGKWEQGLTPIISGGPLEGSYTFAQFHFHWGDCNVIGSEHLVNNKSFPLEIHMVHYKTEYGTPEDAVKHGDGLTVVGFLFELSLIPNYALNAMQDGIKKVKTGGEGNLKPFPLDFFHLSLQADYAAYLGSLTTPPCSEVVTWIISSIPLSVTRKQMEIFREVELAHNIEHNYRPTQPLNGRTVYYVPF